MLLNFFIINERALSFWCTILNLDNNFLCVQYLSCSNLKKNSPNLR